MKAWLRAKLLRWLGYQFVPYTARGRRYCSGRIAQGSLDAAMYFIQMTETEWRSLGIVVEYGLRRVPEVPTGTVRVVLEVGA